MKPPASAEVIAWVKGVLAGIYTPEPNEEIYEWAERTMRIPATENEEMAGMLWSSATTPYVRDLMRWAKRRGKGEFWIKKSSQVGFTMAVLIIICWMIVHRPGNIAYAIDSVEEARKLSRTRLQKWIEENRLLEEIGEEADALNNLTFFFRATTVYMLGAYSKGAWANKSIALFILDELDKHPRIEGEGTTVTLARERCKRPKNAKIIGFSTPGETDQISIEHKTGTCEEIHFPFPCCGTVQPLKKENLVYSSREFKDLAGALDLEKVAIHAYFKCQMVGCTGRLLDSQKMRAMQDYTSVPTNPKARPNIRSLHIWDAYSPFVTFGAIALDWIAAEGNPELLERLYRGVFGEGFERSGSILKHEDVKACRGADERKIDEHGTTTGENNFYLRGHCPFIPLWLTQVTDVQGDIRKSMKIAVDSRGNFWICDWKVTLSLTEAFDWIDVPIIGPEGEELFCDEGFCDEGHIPKTIREECHERILMDSLRAIWPVKGVAVDKVAELVSANLRFIGGNYGEEQILVYSIADRAFKMELFNMIKNRTKRRKAGKPVIYIPSDTDEDAPEHDNLIDELSNEHPFMKKIKGTNREVQDWKKTGHNDYLDTLKYCIGMWTVKRGILKSQGKAA